MSNSTQLDSSVRFSTPPPSSSIDLDLNRAEPGAANRAIGLLGRLDTASSVRKLLQLYLVRAETAGPEWLLVSTLRESSQLEIIIPALEAALSDPPTNVPSTLPQLLADLRTRKDLGVLPPYPTDDAKKPE